LGYADNTIRCCPYDRAGIDSDFHNQRRAATVIRFINCLRRKPDQTIEQFRQHFDDPKFAALMERTAALLGAVRHTKHATLAVQANDLVRQQRGSSAPFDGVLEYWWDNAAHLLERTNSPEGKALTQEMLIYQQQFVDLSSSSGFFTEA
jgi:hypothetical protein